MATRKPAKPNGRGTARSGETSAGTHGPAKEEFLADEYVLDDGPDSERTSSVVFSAPSDSPPNTSGPPPGCRSRFEVPSHLLISPGERRDLIRGFALFVAFLAATVVLVFVRTKTVRREATADSTSQATRPATGAGNVAAVPTPSSSHDAPAGPASGGTEASVAKRAAHGALENGRSSEAIAAGERSVALDPTDAESWLVLAAGYDQGGRHPDALRCFASCVQFADHGPRGDCLALLR
jgi:hypothetical protein